jgi:ribosome-interacting GTPase 1
MSIIPCTADTKCICDVCYPSNISHVTGLPYDEERAAKRKNAELKIRNNEQMQVKSNKANNEQMRMDLIRETKLNQAAVALLRDFGSDDMHMSVILNDIWRRALVLRSFASVPVENLLDFGED